MNKKLDLSKPSPDIDWVKVKVLIKSGIWTGLESLKKEFGNGEYNKKGRF